MQKPFRLLIVDDQPRTRPSLKALLTSGFKLEDVQEASNGKEALNSIVSTQPDIVIMDVRMPELDGIEATRFIKTTYPHIKVILLSMYSEYQEASYAVGADAFITKGEKPELLMRIISNIVKPFSN